MIYKIDMTLQYHNDLFTNSVTIETLKVESESEKIRNFNSFRFDFKMLSHQLWFDIICHVYELPGVTCTLFIFFPDKPTNTIHLYNIYTMTAQCFRRWFQHCTTCSTNDLRSLGTTGKDTQNYKLNHEFKTNTRDT